MVFKIHLDSKLDLKGLTHQIHIMRNLLLQIRMLLVWPTQQIKDVILKNLKEIGNMFSLKIKY